MTATAAPTGDTGDPLPLPAPHIRVDTMTTPEIVSRLFQPAQPAERRKPPHLPTTSEPGLRADLIEELAARRAPDSGRVIAQLLTEQDGDIRRVAADALAEIGDPGTLPDLTAALTRERDGRVRIALVEAIDELRDR